MSQAPVNFDIGSMLGESWNVFKNNVGPLLGGMVLMMVIIAAGNLIPIVGLVIPMLLGGPLVLGYYKMVRSAIAKQPVEFGDLFSGFQKFLPAFLAYLIIAIFTGIGTLLCIIPGIIVSILYAPTWLFLLNDNLDFWPAMEASRKMVSANFVQWLLLFLVMMGINIAGGLACCVGVLVTFPMTFVLITLAFDLERNALLPEIPPVPPVEPAA